MRNQAIEELIRSNPNDEQSYVVYGDWLQEQGDPRGELITLQHRLQADPDNPQLRAAEAEIIDRKRHEIFGPLAEHLGSFAATWRLGVLRELHIHGGRSMESEDKAEDVLSQLLSHESSAFLQSLTLGEFAKSTRRGTPNQLLKHIFSHALPTLRRLFVFDDVNNTKLNASLGAAAGKSMPGLERLVLYGDRVRLGGAKLEQLQALSLHGGEALEENIETIVQGRFNKLSELTVWWHKDVKPMVLGPLLDGGHSSLRSLRLRNMRDTSFVSKLLTSPLARQLETLELSMGSLGEPGAQQLKKSALPNLRSLYLGGNQLPALDKERIAKRFSFARIGNTEETSSGFGGRGSGLGRYYTYVKMRANELGPKSRIEDPARAGLAECAGAGLALYNCGSAPSEFRILRLRETLHYPSVRTYSPGYGNLCSCYARTNDFASIIEIAQRGIACFPQDPNLHSFLVDALRQTDLASALMAAANAASAVCDSIAGRFLLVDIIFTLLMGDEHKRPLQSTRKARQTRDLQLSPSMGATITLRRN